MSIDHPSATTAQAISPHQEVRTRLLPQPTATETDLSPTGGDDGTRVKLSGHIQQMLTDDSHDIDYPKVAALRAAMEAGTLPSPDTKKIARTLLNTVC